MMGRFSKKLLALFCIAGFAVMSLGARAARAQVTYQWDNNLAGERFNNSQTTETEDNWVANAFQVVSGGTRLISVTLGLGETLSNQQVWVVIYQGASIDDPCAGGGLQELQRTQASISGPQFGYVTIELSSPVNLNVGDVFYAAILMRNVAGNFFPFLNDTSRVVNHSFFDTGPFQGAPYDLDIQSWRQTVFGGHHPVVDIAQSPGSLHLRVNANGGLIIETAE